MSKFSVLDMTSVQDFVMSLVGEEMMGATAKFPPFKSEHEGYAIILEEVDELWDAIKSNKTSSKLDRMKEAIQVSAMAMRFVHDLSDEATLDKLGGL